LPARLGLDALDRSGAPGPSNQRDLALLGSRRKPVALSCLSFPRKRESHRVGEADCRPFRRTAAPPASRDRRTVASRRAAPCDGRPGERAIAFV